MSEINFVFVVHNHQPVGNFDHVIANAYEQAYLPFIEEMKRFPDIPLGLHVSGPLWEWIEEHRPEYWDIIKEMVDREQVEIIGGGFYEPILPVLPERDQLGQLQLMNERIADKFGVPPRGAWITERVWEPQLPKPLARSGIKYTFLDDTHFHAAGIPSSKLNGLYLTGDTNHSLMLFPISQRLRYAIPFYDPEDAVHEILAAAGSDDNAVICLADDGEKFGLWPGTHDTCYRQQWLRRFLESVSEKRDVINILRPMDAAQKFNPIGRVYLPTASYFEMTQWALPADASQNLTTIRSELEETGQLERFQPFLRGGHWRNFLSKYEESSRIYHRMLNVSTRVSGMPDSHPNRNTALRELYRAQCNCAYWHGIFGGLYLPHLRGALWEHLINAERLCESGQAVRIGSIPCDIDGNGIDEIRMRGRKISLTVSPEDGRIDDIEVYDPPFNLLDTLARRQEAYHSDIVHTGAQQKTEARKSIHSSFTVKETNLDKLLIYDPYPRRGGIDHILRIEDDLSAFEKGATRMPTTALREHQLDGQNLLMQLNGIIGDIRLPFRKNIKLDPERPQFECCYEFPEVPELAKDFIFGNEWCINLRDGHSDESYIEIPGVELPDAHLDSKCVVENTPRIDLVCRWLNLRVRIDLQPSARIWTSPLLTVSASESGIEKVFQGTMILAGWRLDEGLRCGVTVSVDGER